MFSAHPAARGATKGLAAPSREGNRQPPTLLSLLSGQTENNVRHHGQRGGGKTTRACLLMARYRFENPRPLPNRAFSSRHHVYGVIYERTCDATGAKKKTQPRTNNRLDQASDATRLKKRRKKQQRMDGCLSALPFESGGSRRHLA